MRCYANVSDFAFIFCCLMIGIGIKMLSVLSIAFRRRCLLKKLQGIVVGFSILLETLWICNWWDALQHDKLDGTLAPRECCKLRRLFFNLKQPDICHPERISYYFRFSWSFLKKDILAFCHLDEGKITLRFLFVAQSVNLLGLVLIYELTARGGGFML